MSIDLDTMTQESLFVQSDYRTHINIPKRASLGGVKSEYSVERFDGAGSALAYKSRSTIGFVLAKWLKEKL